MKALNSNRLTSLILVAGAAIAASTGTANAAMSTYSQNFETLVQADPLALGNDGWKVFVNVFAPGPSYLYGYGPFPAPNGGAGFSAIDTGQGGVAQGLQQLSVYSNYNDNQHANGNLLETNVFQEQTVGAADVGSTWTFSFDAKRGNITAPTTAIAFIKTLDPNNFSLSNFIQIDMTNVSTSWGTFSAQIPITAGISGHIIQFGFASTATNYNGSGVFYDNINIVPAPSALALAGVGGLLAARRRRR